MSGGGTFSRLPSAAVCDARVSHSTLRILAAFCIHVDKDGLCFPSVATIAKRVGLSRAGVQYHIRKLERLGYLTVDRKKRSDGMNRVNNYQVSYWDFASVPARVLKKRGKYKADKDASPRLVIGQADVLALTAHQNNSG